MTIPFIPSGKHTAHKMSLNEEPFRDSDCQKSLAEFAASAAKRIRIIFCRGVYLAENTTQAASVEFVRLWRTNYARSRLQKLAEMPEGVFRQALSLNEEPFRDCFYASAFFGHTGRIRSRCPLPLRSQAALPAPSPDPGPDWETRYRRGRMCAAW